VIPIHVADIKKFIGDISTSASGLNEDVSVDKLIQDVIDTTAEFVLQEKFSVSQLHKMSANQKERAKWGLCKYLAGSVLEKRSLNATLTDGGSVSLGPMSMSGWSSGGAIKALLVRAKEMMQEGEDVLDSLRITQGPTGQWAVVDGTSHRRRMF